MMLSNLLQRVGWEVGIFLAIIFSFMDHLLSFGKMMVPSGASAEESSGNTPDKIIRIRAPSPGAPDTERRRSG